MSQQHSQPGMGKSSLEFGVVGESRNAPYGPKAAYECGIMEGKEEGETFEKNHVLYGDFAVGKTSNLPEPSKEVSSLKP